MRLNLGRRAGRELAAEIEHGDLITDVEDEFGVTVPDEEVEKIKTINDAIEFVKKQSEAPVEAK